LGSEGVMDCPFSPFFFLAPGRPLPPPPPPDSVSQVIHPADNPTQIGMERGGDEADGRAGFRGNVGRPDVPAVVFTQHGCRVFFFFFFFVFRAVRDGTDGTMPRRETRLGGGPGGNLGRGQGGCSREGWTNVGVRRFRAQGARENSSDGGGGCLTPGRFTARGGTDPFRSRAVPPNPRHHRGCEPGVYQWARAVGTNNPTGGGGQGLPGPKNSVLPPLYRASTTRGRAEPRGLTPRGRGKPQHRRISAAEGSKKARPGGDRLGPTRDCPGTKTGAVTGRWAWPIALVFGNGGGAEARTSVGVTSTGRGSRTGASTGRGLAETRFRRPVCLRPGFSPPAGRFDCSGNPRGFGRGGTRTYRDTIPEGGGETPLPRNRGPTWRSAGGRLSGGLNGRRHPTPGSGPDPLFPAIEPPSNRPTTEPPPPRGGGEGASGVLRPAGETGGGTALEGGGDRREAACGPELYVPARSLRNGEPGGPRTGTRGGGGMGVELHQAPTGRRLTGTRARRDRRARAITEPRALCGGFFAFPPDPGDGAQARGGGPDSKNSRLLRPTCCRPRGGTALGGPSLSAPPRQRPSTIRGQVPGKPRARPPTGGGDATPDHRGRGSARRPSPPPRTGEGHVSGAGRGFARARARGRKTRETVPYGRSGARDGPTSRREEPRGEGGGETPFRGSP